MFSISIVGLCALRTHSLYAKHGAISSYLLLVPMDHHVFLGKYFSLTSNFSNKSRIYKVKANKKIFNGKCALVFICHKYKIVQLYNILHLYFYI